MCRSFASLAILDARRRSPSGGVSPINYVYNVIDGREAFKAHGTRAMPIWGKHLSFRAAPLYDDYPYDADVFVRSRILAVIDYLYRLQVK